MKLNCSVLLLAGFAVLAGCFTVPETGRRTFNLISPEMEASMGASAFQDIKREEKISTDDVRNARLQRVGQRIATVASKDIPNAQWEFVVFDDPEQINAFALPGGKVGVYTGLMNLAETDDELAAVIGHEIAHITARHGGERMSQAIAMTVGAIAVEQAVQDSSNRDLWRVAYGAGATLGVALPYSRLNEREADEIGLIYAARAGYDPRAALTFWGRMIEANKNRPKPPEFFSTHPADQTRMATLEAMMPNVVPVYERARAERGEG